MFEDPLILNKLNNKKKKEKISKLLLKNKNKYLAACSHVTKKNYFNHMSVLLNHYNLYVGNT